MMYQIYVLLCRETRIKICSAIIHNSVKGVHSLGCCYGDIMFICMRTLWPGYLWCDCVHSLSVFCVLVCLSV